MHRTSDPDLNPKMKNDNAGSVISDCDSGFHEPGVLSVPLVRTFVHCDSKGNRKLSTTNDVINVKRKSSKSCPSSRTPSTTSLNHSPSTSEDGRVKANQGGMNPKRESISSVNSNDNLDQPMRKRSPTPVSSSEEKDDSFTRENKKEQDSSYTIRGYTRHAILKDRFLPTIRDGTVSKTNHFTETVTKKRRPKLRSKSVDSNRRGYTKSIFSPLYTKILSEEEMARRREWAAIIKKDCILEEEYYKVPYEECNREVILGRFSRSQPSLNFLRKSRKKVSFSEDTNENTERNSRQEVVDTIKKNVKKATKATNLDASRNDEQNNSEKDNTPLCPSTNESTKANDINSLSESDSTSNLQTLIQLIKEIKTQPVAQVQREETSKEASDSCSKAQEHGSNFQFVDSSNNMSNAKNCDNSIKTKITEPGLPVIDCCKQADIEFKSDSYLDLLDQPRTNSLANESETEKYSDHCETKSEPFKEHPDHDSETLAINDGNSFEAQIEDFPTRLSNLNEQGEYHLQNNLPVNSSITVESLNAPNTDEKDKFLTGSCNDPKSNEPEEFSIKCQLNQSAIENYKGETSQSTADNRLNSPEKEINNDSDSSSINQYGAENSTNSHLEKAKTLSKIERLSKSTKNGHDNNRLSHPQKIMSTFGNSNNSRPKDFGPSQEFSIKSREISLDKYKESSPNGTSRRSISEKEFDPELAQKPNTPPNISRSSKTINNPNSTRHSEELISPNLVASLSLNDKPKVLSENDNDTNNNFLNRNETVTNKPPRAPKARPRTKLPKANGNLASTIPVQQVEHSRENRLNKEPIDISLATVEKVTARSDNRYNNNAAINKALKNRIAARKRMSPQSQSKSKSPDKNVSQRDRGPPYVKNDTVDIFMRQNANFTDHHIELTTCVNTLIPNMSVTRMKVPFSAIRDQWEWAKHFWPLPGMMHDLCNQSQLETSNLNLRMKKTAESPSLILGEDCNLSNNGNYSKDSLARKDQDMIVSPTPSCWSTSSGSSTSGCFSASCSPSPLPNTLKVFPLPTPL